MDLRRSAVLIDSDGQSFNVTILDVSSGGFRLKVEESPRIGEFITLVVEHGARFSAQVRWVLGHEAGGVFLNPVDHEESAILREEATTMLDRRTGEDRRGDDRREQEERREGSRRDAGRRDGDRRKADRRES